MSDQVRVEIDKDHCIGAAQCVLAAPEIFRQDEDGISTLRTPDVRGAGEEQAREAADVCPVRAITVTA